MNERLRQDPVFRFLCGFPVASQTPSVSTFSCFFKVISENELLERYYLNIRYRCSVLKGFTTA
ncbi:transposase [Desulfolucanica intricata]|uniref:transposase n=1 Tax=Desulfolucanica intricata TaxID=1285191 RepID=UPI00350E3EFB